MKESTRKILEELLARYPVLTECRKEIEDGFQVIANAYLRGGKLLVAGNGGSAADCEHIVGELMKGFGKKRPLDGRFLRSLMQADAELGAELAARLQGALPAISLAGHPALATAFLNDVEPVMGLAQQTYGFGRQGDVLLAITTSGNSRNILYAAVTAKAKDMPVIVLTGKDGGMAKRYADVAILVDEQETFKIQELHLPIYHVLCLMLEDEFFES